MSKVGNALRMFIILQSRGKMKIKDLARELEVDVRQIRRYRDDLMQAGIYIKSDTGKYGGYSIENNNAILRINLTEQEYIALMIANEELKETNHLVVKDYTTAIEKISAMRKNPYTDFENQYNYVIKGAMANINFEEERKKLIDVYAASITKNKVKISYTSLSSGLTERVIRPYATFKYKGDMYFTGYCEKKEAVIDFKLCRVKGYEILKEKFIMDKSFNLEERMKNCIGIFKDEEIDVKLIIKHPMSQIVKEKIWVKNQKIRENEDQSIVYEATMEGLKEIKSWILSMGSSVKVITPQKLIEEIKKEIENLKKIY
ncbi:WYL domain-containing transcriptional regulator [Clostridiaceae bacterium 35-E11]